jgi:hypothetical protein
MTVSNRAMPSLPVASICVNPRSVVSVTKCRSESCRRSSFRAEIDRPFVLTTMHDGACCRSLSIPIRAPSSSDGIDAVLRTQRLIPRWSSNFKGISLSLNVIKHSDEIRRPTLRQSTKPVPIASLIRYISVAIIRVSKC